MREASQGVCSPFLLKDNSREDGHDDTRKVYCNEGDRKVTVDEMDQGPVEDRLRTEVACHRPRQAHDQDLDCHVREEEVVHAAGAAALGPS